MFNSAAVVGLPPSEGDFYLYTQDAAEVDDPDYLNAKSKLRKLGRNGVYHIGRADLPTPDLETNREVSREHGEITVDFNGASVRYKDISKNGSVVEVHESATNQTLEDVLKGRKPQEPRFRAKDRQQVYQEEVDKRGGLN